MGNTTESNSDNFKEDELIPVTDDLKDSELISDITDVNGKELIPSTVVINDDEHISDTIDVKGNELMPDTVDLHMDELIVELERLIEGNKKCVFKLFVFECLPFDSYEGGSNTLVQVHSDEFPTFMDLEQYVTSIYCDKESTRLLYGNNGKALYLDVNGVLYMDVKMLGGMGYFVNWDDYGIEIRNLQADICDFDLITTEDYYGEISEKIFCFQALLENNTWKLKEMVY
jgi:hypothetical protein